MLSECGAARGSRAARSAARASQLWWDLSPRRARRGWRLIILQKLLPGQCGKGDSKEAPALVASAAHVDNSGEIKQERSSSDITVAGMAPLGCTVAPLDAHVCFCGQHVERAVLLVCYSVCSRLLQDSMSREQRC